MTAIWRQYDRTGLDAQYNLRAAVPSFQQHYDRWQAWSARVRAALPCRLDVAYGPAPLETLDLFPAAAANRPIHVFIHGGYWHRMDKSDFDFIAEGFAPQGVNAAIINYPLAPQVDMDAIVASVRRALAWLWRNARTFGGDPARIHVSGHSAGGHLTAMMLLTDWPAFGADLPADLVKGGVAISGIYELEPIRLCYLDEMVRLDPDKVARNSPQRLLAAARAASPLALCVGGDETAEFHRQQADFAAAWGARGFARQIVSAPGLHHFNVVDELALAGRPLNRAALAQTGLAVQSGA
jgi:arylformamidase